MSTNPIDAPLADFAAANDSPTTVDVYNIAKQLQHAYAARLGIAPKHAPVKALIDGEIAAVDLARRLALGGLEIYADCLGNACIRTKEQGDAHRDLVQAEKDVAYLERNPSMAPYSAAGRRFRPSEPERVRDRDEEAE
jgi:hypothetical protein